MAKQLLPLFLFFVACSPPISSENQCLTDPACGEGLVCDDGTCVVQPAESCRSDETKPCGPAAVGICRPGVNRCINGAFESVCLGAVTATTETCNGLDDDCDGTVDDGVITTWYVDADNDGFGSSAPGAASQKACEKPAGYVASSTDCDDGNSMRKPMAPEVCDALDVDENCDGVANEGCQCENPGVTQACCSGRGTQTCTAQSGGAVLSMCTAQPSLELCNAIDDDCDGQTDESFSTTSSDGGLFTLDAGTLFADGGCAVGIGACARTGTPTCVSGDLACGVVPGAPTTELCDSLDNDCDGQSDEGLLIQCQPDADNDRYPGSNATTEFCPDPSRPSFGNCPAGFVAPAAALGTAVDCDDSVGTVFHLIPLRGDEDGDGYCSGAPMDRCIGSSAPGGLRFASACRPSDDCDDTSAAKFLLASLRRDADADAYCIDAATTQCIGSSPPAGMRFTFECQATDDCLDTSPSRYRLLSVMSDSDGDGYCTGSTLQQCAGQSPLPGFRLSTTCAAQADCNDGNAGEWQFLSVRADADNDTWCSGTTFSQCTGNTPKVGTRLASQCAGNDCRDSNPNATSSCQTTVSSQTQTKICNTGVPVTQTLSFPWQCPAGFVAAYSTIVKVSTTTQLTDPATSTPDVGGASSGPTGVNFTCRFAAVGSDSWRLDVTCGAQ